MKELMNKAGEIGQDNLIARPYPSAYTTGVTIRAVSTATTYLRGTVMAKSSIDGKLVILGTAAAAASGSDPAEVLTPAYVLCDPVEIGTEDVGTVAFRSGNFNTKALIVKDGYTLTEADRDALRQYDIVLNDNMQ